MPRRKLGDADECELARLYAETETPVSEIRKRFGVAKGSVYRIAQRRGAKLRSLVVGPDRWTSMRPRSLPDGMSTLDQAPQSANRARARRDYVDLLRALLAQAEAEQALELAKTSAT